MGKNSEFCNANDEEQPYRITTIDQRIKYFASCDASCDYCFFAEVHPPSFQILFCIVYYPFLVSFFIILNAMYILGFPIHD